MKKINNNTSVTVRISSNMRMMIETIAEDEKTSVSKLLREIIEKYIIDKLGA